MQKSILVRRLVLYEEARQLADGRADEFQKKTKAGKSKRDKEVQKYDGKLLYGFAAYRET